MTDQFLDIMLFGFGLSRFAIKRPQSKVAWRGE